MGEDGADLTQRDLLLVNRCFGPVFSLEQCTKALYHFVPPPHLPRPGAPCCPTPGTTLSALWCWLWLTTTRRCRMVSLGVTGTFHDCFNELLCHLRIRSKQCSSVNQTRVPMCDSSCFSTRPAAKYTTRVLLLDEVLASEEGVPAQHPLRHSQQQAGPGIAQPLAGGRPPTVFPAPPSASPGAGPFSSPAAGDDAPGLQDGLPQPEIPSSLPAASTAVEAMELPGGSSQEEAGGGGRTPGASCASPCVAAGLRNPAAADALGDVQVLQPCRAAAGYLIVGYVSAWLHVWESGSRWRRQPLSSVSPLPSLPARWTCTPARRRCWAR